VIRMSVYFYNIPHVAFKLSLKIFRHAADNITLDSGDIKQNFRRFGITLAGGFLIYQRAVRRTFVIIAVVFIGTVVDNKIMNIKLGFKLAFLA